MNNGYGSSHSESIYSNSEYLTHNPSWHVEHSAWKAMHVSRMLERNAIRPTRIVEVGCGAGEVLAQVKKAFPEAHLVGYEISPQAFDLCRSRERDGLEFRNRSIAEDTDTYDLLMCLDVFEHVDDYIGFLRSLRERANWKIFHIPLDVSAQSVFRGSPLLDIRRSVGHLHHFTAATAIDTLRYCGYEILESCYTGGSIDFADRGWKAQVMKLPRKLLFGVAPNLCVRVLGGWSLMVLTR